MQIHLYCNPLDMRAPFATALRVGIMHHGHQCAVKSIYSEFSNARCDVAVILGARKPRLFEWLKFSGTPFVFIDAGYSHRGRYWRHAINGTQPIQTYSAWLPKPSDRREMLGWDIKPWKISRSTDHVLLVSSGHSHHEVEGLGPIDDWAVGVVRNVRMHTTRQIIFRQKGLKLRVPGTAASPFESLSMDLEQAHVMITHGSSACIEAVRAGVPCIVIGNAPAGPISSRSLSLVEKPRMVSYGEREQWLNDLAYWQWSVEEHASGLAWRHVEQQLGALRVRRQA